MNCKEMIEAWLKDHGYDGLCNPELECGCGLGDFPFMPCESCDLIECVPAYKGPNLRDSDDTMFYTDKAVRDKAVVEAGRGEGQESEEEDTESGDTRLLRLASLRRGREEMDEWTEGGERRTARRVDPNTHGPHLYDENGTSDCAYGCGCWAGPSRSGGPVNPFGACPKNLKAAGRGEGRR